MAVGEGNYGRLGPDQQGRYTAGNRRLMLPQPDEQPGAMPEILPSPDYVRSIDQRLVDRAMVLQAWGAYGTAWPVVRQQLGVGPTWAAPARGGAAAALERPIEARASPQQRRGGRGGRPRRQHLPHPWTPPARL